jgi:hypothetical protein
MRPLLRTLLLLHVVVLVATPRVFARTWIVTPGPGFPRDRIGSVVQQASTFDTVLVEPGTYYENIPVWRKVITLISSAGAEKTILDGSIPIEGRHESIIYSAGYQSPTLFIDGFTFRNGGGSPNEVGTVVGGAINCWSGFGNTTGLIEIRNCRFESNRAGRHVDGKGGALYFASLDRVYILDCEFGDNQAVHGGGDIYIRNDGPDVIQGCTFVITHSSGNGAAINAGSHSVEIRDNHFISPPAGRSSTGIFMDSPDVRIIGNRFEDHRGNAAARMTFSLGGVVGDVLVRLEFSSNTVWNDGPIPEGPGSMIRANFRLGDIEVFKNTFVGVTTSWSAVAGRPLLYQGNIIYKGRVLLDSTHGGEVLCNDSWPDTIAVTPFGSYVFEGNISRNPLFCDEAVGDFSIARQSPCAAANSPSGCGLIGAGETACELTRVERVSWGRIKARYR